MAYKELEPLSEEALAKANADLEAKDRVARQQAAVAMRVAGAAYSEIARTLEYPSVTAARQAVERALAASVGEEGREQLRFIEGRRLERLLRSVWGRATSEDVEVDGKKVPNPDHLAYVRTALAIIDRHARLYGADAPQEMIVYNPAGIEIEAWVANMARQVQGELPEEYDIIEGQTIDDNPVGDDS